MPLPDVFIIGAPKAGTSALHAALTTHHRLYMSPVKEPKYFLCGDEPPRAAAHRGPGDAHSAQEWVWSRARYEALFADAPAGQLRGESTPFYLYDHAAHVRISAAVPHAKLIAIVRDPVDRAYSNWTHLWADGLEPIDDFAAACAAEADRIAEGYAPFWHYQALSRYGEQFEHLLSVFPREQVHLLRYRDLVDAPSQTLDTICRFLGVEQGVAHAVPSENIHPFVVSSARAKVLGSVIRAGAYAGACGPPNLWRSASIPLTWALQRGGGRRPALPVDVRRDLVDGFTEDIRRLETVTGEDFSDWLGDESRGEFTSRQVGAAS